MDEVVVIVMSLVLSAFFSGSEIAFVASNKLKIEMDRKQNVFPSRIVSSFVDNPSQYISTMLVGNNVALVVYGIYMALILEPWINNYFHAESSILIVQTIISTLIILITAEFLPKTIFRLNPNVLLNVFALPLILFYILLYPVARFSILISNVILKNILKVPMESKDKKKQLVFSKIDLHHFIHDTGEPSKSENGEEPELKIFKNALDFSKIKIRECVIPRTEVVAVDEGSTLEEIKQKFIETGYSKILVYRESIDNIIGYMHHSELFKNPEDVKSGIRKIFYVPETMPAHKLLRQFIDESKSIAVVVDEFGGTAGIVTMEDIIEEIFGEIEDEYDSSDLEEKQVNENEYILSARLEIDYLNEKYGIGFPASDDYETIAGFILYNYENIPKLNEVIRIQNFSLKILRVSSTRIGLVRLIVD